MTGTRRWFGSLRLRLLAAFVTVAVGAVALLALVAVVSVDRRTDALAAAQRAQLRTQIATALAAAYSAGRGSWSPTNLAAVQTLAGAHHTAVVVVDRTGHDVARYIPGHDTWDMPAGSGSSGGSGQHDGDTTHHDSSGTSPGAGTTSSPADTSSHTDSHPTTPPLEPSRHSGMNDGGFSDSGHGLLARAATAGPVLLAAGPSLPAATTGTEPVSVPIVVNGRQVGTAKLTLPAALDPSLSEARAALLRTVWLGAALAVMLATVAAVFVSRRMSRPLVALTAATRAFAAGDPAADQLVRPGPGEVGELGQAFTTMAASVRRQEELRRAVVADVAHELRTPVTILRGQTEALLDGIAEASPAQLTSLHDEVLRLGRLTDDLATLSAADAAGLPLQPTTVDLGKLAAGTVDAMATVLDDAELTVHVAADEGVTVRGDEARLTQVVTNLLSNAAKFTAAGGTVTVTTARRGPDAVLTVADTGAGIPVDELPHLFERFWRGRAAGSRSGTGIGLAVVQALVTAHRGTVTAASPADGGAVFTVRLPAS